MLNFKLFIWFLSKNFDRSITLSNCILSKRLSSRMYFSCSAILWSNMTNSWAEIIIRIGRCLQIYYRLLLIFRIGCFNLLGIYDKSAIPVFLDVFNKIYVMLVKSLLVQINWFFSNSWISSWSSVLFSFSISWDIKSWWYHFLELWFCLFEISLFMNFLLLFIHFKQYSWLSSTSWEHWNLIHWWFI